MKRTKGEESFLSINKANVIKLIHLYARETIHFLTADLNHDVSRNVKSDSLGVVNSRYKARMLLLVSIKMSLA